MFPYLGAREFSVAGVAARLLRVGFVGELGYEVHVPADQALYVWDALMAAGKDHGLRAFGVEAQRLLRLEKGHVIVGQDTELDSTPRRINMDWAVKLEKDAFVGGWGAPIQDGPRVEVAINGSVPMAMYAWVSGETTVQGEDGWGYPALPATLFEGERVVAEADPAQALSGTPAPPSAP
jgi:sarcosine oxidase subunit alpha